MARELTSLSARKIASRRLIVDRNFQMKYSLTLCALGFAFSTCIGATLLFVLRQNYDLLVSDRVVQSPEVIAQIASSQGTLLWIFFGMAVLTVSSLFWSGILITNRFIGPVKGLERELAKLKNGDYSAFLHLRSGDEFQQIAELFNKSLEVLREETQEEARMLAHWHESVTSDPRKIHNEIEHVLQKKKKKINYFTHST